MRLTLLNLSCIVQDHAGTLVEILLAQSILIATIRSKLVQQDGVSLAVLDIAREVLDELVL